MALSTEQGEVSPRSQEASADSALLVAAEFALPGVPKNKTGCEQPVLESGKQVTTQLCDMEVTEPALRRVPGNADALRKAHAAPRVSSGLRRSPRSAAKDS